MAVDTAKESRPTTDTTGDPAGETDLEHRLSLILSAGVVPDDATRYRGYVSSCTPLTKRMPCAYTVIENGEAETWQ